MNSSPCTPTVRQVQCLQANFIGLQKWPKYFAVLPLRDEAYSSLSCPRYLLCIIKYNKSNTIQVPDPRQKRPWSSHSCVLKTQRLPWEKAKVSLLDDELAHEYILPQVIASQLQNSHLAKYGSWLQMSETRQLTAHLSPPNYWPLNAELSK